MLALPHTKPSDRGASALALRAAPFLRRLSLRSNRGRAASRTAWSRAFLVALAVCAAAPALAAPSSDAPEAERQSVLRPFAPASLHVALRGAAPDSAPELPAAYP